MIWTIIAGIVELGIVAAVIVMCLDDEVFRG